MQTATDHRVNDAISDAAGRLGLTQSALAGILSLSRSAVDARLNGRTRWTVSEVATLARVLELDVHALLAVDEVPDHRRSMTMPTSALPRTVTAIPVGTKDGQPITRRYTHTIIREPEPFGEHDGRPMSRLWQKDPNAARHGLDRVSPAGIFWTDSIEDTALLAGEEVPA